MKQVTILMTLDLSRRWKYACTVVLIEYLQEEPTRKELYAGYMSCRSIYQLKGF